MYIFKLYSHHSDFTYLSVILQVVKCFDLSKNEIVLYDNYTFQSWHAVRALYIVMTIIIIEVAVISGNTVVFLVFIIIFILCYILTVEDIH